MKKKLMCGLVLSVSLFSISAYAADGDDALTTKKYVNSGLSFVYKVANGTETGAVQDIKTALSDGNNGLINVGTLSNKIGTEGNGTTAGTGLIGDVENLQSVVGARGTGDVPGTGLAGAVQSLETTIGDGTTGLSKDVTDVKGALSNGEGGLVNVGALQQTVSTLQSTSKTYTAGTGIEFTGDDSSKIGIALPANATDGANYVFQSDGAGGGTWTKMEVATEWNSSFLTGGN